MSHDDPGCSDEDCQNLICLLDPFCCDTTWDGVCANEALRNPLCTAGCGVVSTPVLTEDDIPVGEIRNANHVIGSPVDWLPPPPGADDCFDSWIRFELTIFTPFCEEDLWLPGQFRVLRDHPVESPPGSGHDLIATLMAKARFDGDSSCAGPVTIRLDPSESSTGEITSLTPEELFPADSFFDVWIEVDTGLGVLHTDDPALMTTTINSLPPEDGETYFGSGTVIPLYDATGGQIGEIVVVAHEIHATVGCPSDFRSWITFPGKEAMDVRIPESGGGLGYDVWEGSLSGVASLPGTILQVAGPGLVPVPGPPPGGGAYYLSRTRFGGYGASWDSGGPSQAGDRDIVLP